MPRALQKHCEPIEVIYRLRRRKPCGFLSTHPLVISSPPGPLVFDDQGQHHHAVEEFLGRRSCLCDLWGRLGSGSGSGKPAQYSHGLHVVKRGALRS